MRATTQGCKDEKAQEITDYQRDNCLSIGHFFWSPDLFCYNWFVRLFCGRHVELLL